MRVSAFVSTGGCYGDRHLDLANGLIGASSDCRPKNACKRSVQADSLAGGVAKLTEFQASRNVLAKAQGDSVGCSRRSSARWPRDILYNYWLKGRQIWMELAHVSVVLDGGRAGEELLVTGVWSSQAEIGLWAPPQASI